MDSTNSEDINNNGITSKQRKIRIINEGEEAAKQGKKIEDNPYIICGQRFQVYSAIWDKGFNNFCS